MAKVELIFHVIESGSNSMSTFQAIQSAATSPNDALSLFQNGSNLVAAVSNVSPMLQPIRIMTNGLVATSALMRIVTDWQDPNKKVQPGDVLTLVSAAGTVAITLLVWAEIGPGAAAAIGAVALSADLQANFQPYMSAARIWLGNYMSNFLQVSNPASVASSSLYWSAPSTYTGYTLATYDEIMGTNSLFVCLSDKGVTGASLVPLATPVPGSYTPINEDQYKEAYCRSLAQPTTDLDVWLPYCKTEMVR